MLAARGVRVHRNAAVTEVFAGRLQTSSGEWVDADEMVWVTRAGGAAWLQDTGLALDTDGFIQVTDTFQTVTDSSIFAAGDIATMVNCPLEKAGVFAVRQGPRLAGAPRGPPASTATSLPARRATAGNWFWNAMTDRWLANSHQPIRIKMNTSAHHKARRGLRAGTADAGGLGLCMSHHKKTRPKTAGRGVNGDPRCRISYSIPAISGALNNAHLSIGWMTTN